MTYGERIRRGREAKALTQEELAEALGVSRQAVSKWEGDLSRPAAGKLALLSETLDIPWDAWQAMDAEEAVLQMNLLGHQFFIFREMHTGDINVVYRRKDGNYGLICPEE